MAILNVFGESVDRLTGAFQLSGADFGYGDIADYYAYCARERERELQQTGQFKPPKKNQPEAAIEHNILRTRYIPIYRIHSKRYFEAGVNFPKNWTTSERKQLRIDRYSPFGTEGFYFSLTLPGAEDEARYYGAGKIDPNDQMILVMEACFDNVLDLCSGALPWIWQAAGLQPPQSLSEMYLKVMDPMTGNPDTNAIGRWARKRGLDGLIYPSARYDQADELQLAKANGITVVPVVNWVDTGSHIPWSAALPLLHRHLSDYARVGDEKKWVTAFSEPNLVLFGPHQLSGEQRGIIYQTFPLGMRDQVLAQDDLARRRSSTYTIFAAETLPFE